MIPNVFAYLDYRAYLRAWFADRKATEPGFGHRVFVRRIGRSSPSLLVEVMRGPRKLSAALLPRVVEVLELSPPESSFFSALVEYNQAETPAQKAAAWESVRASRRFHHARKLGGDSVRYLSAWYIPAIRELARCKDFRADPVWIARRLVPHITPAEAQRALDVLLDIGFLTRHTDGRTIATTESIVTPHEVPGADVIHYHADMIERAGAALTTTPPNERHYAGLIVAVPMRLLPDLKRELDTFQQRLLDLCASEEGTHERVYQINLHLLPLSGSDG